MILDAQPTNSSSLSGMAQGAAPSQQLAVSARAALPAGDLRARPVVKSEASAAASDNSLALIAGAAFTLYWLSSMILAARGAATHFGADSHLFTPLAQGEVVDRIARFHPLTVAAATIWMKTLGPLSGSISPGNLLKAMFAAVGAGGVWAAGIAFAHLVPRREAVLWTIIYAVSLGVWYFSSIEESKIVTASLASIYVAIYLKLREQWTVRGAVLLTVVLALACLNEIVSCFLVAIPAVDLLARDWRNWRGGAWIALHALAAPAVLLFLELVVNGILVAPTTEPEGRSHLSLLFFYMTTNDHGFESLYLFLLNWFFFNIAAPTPDATLWQSLMPAQFKGYFPPDPAKYLAAPYSMAVLLLTGAIGLISFMPFFRQGLPKAANGIRTALAAYLLVRGVFFFLFNPSEPLLFSPAITLALMLLFAIPFARSTLAQKDLILSLFAGCLFVTNVAFILGR